MSLWGMKLWKALESRRDGGLDLFRVKTNVSKCFTFMGIKETILPINRQLFLRVIFICPRKKTPSRIAAKIDSIYTNHVLFSMADLSSAQVS